MSLSRLFIRQVIRELCEEKREGIHVSDLVNLSICARKFWFDKHDPQIDFDSLLRMWQGKKLHDIRLGDMHEFEVRYDDVIGRIDDYNSELGILIDKKFVSYLPRDDKDVEHYYSHYITQLKLYYYMMIMTGYYVKEACLLFVNVNEKQPFREYIFTPSFDESEKLFKSLKEKALKILNDKIPEIPSSFSPYDYPCSYCQYRPKCYYLDATEVNDNAKDV